MAGSLTDLPDAMLGVVPALAEHHPPEETRADCANCPISAKEDTQPTSLRPFKMPVRCCTYQPSLPNFLVGRSLSRGEQGSHLIRNHLSQNEGVHPLGILPTEDWTRQYERTRATDFGKDPSKACPYWTPGDLGCGIWNDRPAVCRTWHCRHTSGARAQKYWAALGDLLLSIEYQLASWCVEQQVPPAPFHEHAEQWYRDCWSKLSTIPADSWSQSAAVLEALVAFQNARDALERPMPEQLIPVVSELVQGGTKVAIGGYSSLDLHWWPSTVLSFLSSFDGQKTVDACIADARNAWSREDVQRLWNAGILAGEDD